MKLTSTQVLGLTRLEATSARAYERAAPHLRLYEQAEAALQLMAKEVLGEHWEDGVGWTTVADGDEVYLERQDGDAPAD